jgi:micrococcal nuclease
MPKILWVLWSASLIWAQNSISDSLKSEMTLKVVQVKDGDTFVALNQYGHKICVRLWGIDTPELKQNSGDSAQIFAEKILNQKVVRVDVVDIDRYGRLVSKVYVDSIDLNRSLLAAGWAWWYEHYNPNDDDFKNLQNQAKKMKLGLWKDLNSVAPWIYRKENKKGK